MFKNENTQNFFNFFKKITKAEVINIKQYEKYSDIPSKYKWNLEDILKGKSLEELISEYKTLYEKRIETKEEKYDSLDKYLLDIEISEKLTLLSFKINNYLSNNLNTNVVDSKWLSEGKKWELLKSNLVQKFGSEINRFYKHIDKMRLWKEDNRLKNYKLGIQDLINSFDHKLSDEVEEYIVQTQIGNPDPHEIFGILTDSELDYGYVTSSKGKKIKLTRANRSKLLKSDDKAIRKGAYYNFINSYLKHKSSLSSTLYQHFNSLVIEAKIRKYSSTVEMLTYDDKVDEKTITNIYLEILKHKKIVAQYRKFFKIFYQKKFKEKCEKWDSSRELVDVKSEYTVEEAKELVRTSLKPFGKEYLDQINKALDENWIDFMIAKSKRSGAYSIGGSFGLNKKYILMNFNGQLGSVETLAHELGHSMHSYYSDTRQPLPLSQYPIFLAEIASIFNELMLFDYLLQTSNNDKLKFKILDLTINGFLGTVWRQIEWSNYEYDLYKAIEKNEPVNNWEAISELYYKNSKKYSLSSKTKKYKEEDVFGSIYVPHFYYGFYVYKYAIGQLCAIYFFNEYKQKGQKALENYVNNFLSAGCSDHPLEILKKVGIDLNDTNYYRKGFEYLDVLIKQWIALGKKIFK